MIGVFRFEELAIFTLSIIVANSKRLQYVHFLEVISQTQIDEKQKAIIIKVLLQQIINQLQTAFVIESSVDNREKLILSKQIVNCLLRVDSEVEFLCQTLA